MRRSTRESDHVGFPPAPFWPIASKPPYSSVWVDTFLRTVPDGQTDRETAFLVGHLPRPRVRTVLDLCCGLGRHAVRLAEAGYLVTGIDRDASLLRQAARARVDNPRYVAMDARDVGALRGTFDAVVSMWASFGYFTEEDNRRHLSDLRRCIGDGGRLILDLYHRAFFEAHQGRRERVHWGRPLIETKSVHDGRLVVQLDYEDGGGDTFEWEVFTPQALERRAEAAGFRCALVCTAFDAKRPPAPDSPRFQMVLDAVPRA